MPLIEDLTATAEQDYRDWKKQARFYGSTSSLVRPLLIICTALVAAEKTIKPHIPANVELLFPALSIVVAIGTSLDAWLKPREKWRGFLADRDAANILLMKARNVDKADSAKIDALLEELRLLEQRHIEKNVY